ncbi:MAG: hypothetical protein ABEH43_05520, partial [Flavobacteriales bacterium]
MSTIKHSKLYNNFQGMSLLLVLRALLDLSYSYIVLDHYSYMGFDHVFSWISIIESYFLLILTYFFLPKDQDRPSHFISVVFYVLGYLPITSYYGLSSASRDWFLLTTMFIFVLILVIRIPVSFK